MFHFMIVYILKLVKFPVSTVFPVWMFFVNPLLDCGFAWVYTDRFEGFLCVLYFHFRENKY